MIGIDAGALTLNASFAHSIEQTACHFYNFNFYNILYYNQDAKAILMGLAQRCERDTQRRMQRGISPSFDAVHLYCLRKWFANRSKRRLRFGAWLENDTGDGTTPPWAGLLPNG